MQKSQKRPRKAEELPVEDRKAPVGTNFCFLMPDKVCILAGFLYAQKAIHTEAGKLSSRTMSRPSRNEHNIV